MIVPLIPVPREASQDPVALASLSPHPAVAAVVSLLLSFQMPLVLMVARVSLQVLVAVVMALQVLLPVAVPAFQVLVVALQFLWPPVPVVMVFQVLVEVVLQLSPVALSSWLPVLVVDILLI